MKSPSSLVALFLAGFVQGFHSSLPPKHPLEAKKSWENFVANQEEIIDNNIHRPRHLEYVAVQTNNADEDTPYTVKHKKRKKHIPFPNGDTTHGLMIDAGSQGTRLHIYEWKKRYLLDQDDLLDVTEGKLLSIPTSNSRWTDKYTPGLDVFAYHKHPDKLKKALAQYLGPLLEFAKQVLQDKEDQWPTYPIYLKATGGCRTLSKHERVRLFDAVRELFFDPAFNPFQFEEDRARVISGEEEAIYGWVGVNFALGKLIQNSIGKGAAQSRKLTYGMLEMGGASTQIAVYENHGDVMANLFKLQLGGARHWNVYVHSYLYFGINGAWTRLNGRLHWENSTTNPCLPIGSEIEFSSFATMDEYKHFYPRSDPRSVPYSVNMSNDQSTFDFEDCSQRTYKLLRKDANQEWCEFEMDGSCGFAGIYQPPLPKLNKDIDEFVATSNFADVFAFLKLGDKAVVSTIGDAAEHVCNLNWEELQHYNAKLDAPIENDDAKLAQMCFRSVFVYQLLANGWGFGEDYEMMAADVINGQKLGWALGCMLYEINTLPWHFHPELLFRGPSWYLVTLYVILGILGGGAIGFVIAMRTSKRFNRRVRESVFFQNTAVGKNPMLRRSLALPVETFDSLRSELEEEEKQTLQSDDSGIKYT